MPVYSIRLAEGNPRASLQRFGPSVPIQVGWPELLARACAKEGEEIPEDQRGRCLIDTGASATAVDLSVLDALDAPVVGNADLSTPSGTESRKVYSVRLEFPGSGLPTQDPMVVIGVDLTGFNGLDALLGRDFLEGLLMVYDGTAGRVTLAF